MAGTCKRSCDTPVSRRRKSTSATIRQKLLEAKREGNAGQNRRLRHDAGISIKERAAGWFTPSAGSFIHDFPDDFSLTTAARDVHDSAGLGRFDKQISGVPTPC
jgi:hypothetical protein